MSNRFCSVILTLGVLALFVSNSGAQALPDRIKTIQSNLDNARATYDGLPDDAKKNIAPDNRLSQLSKAMGKMATGLTKGVNPGWQPSNVGDDGQADDNGLIQVNNPARDLRFSPFIGYTQTDASTARCGQSVVVAFNDSGSILETVLSGSGGLTTFPNAPPGNGGVSTTGYATSHNGGETFKDRGAVNPGPDTSTFLMGRPSVACSDASNFYMVQEARFKSNLGYLQPVQAIALSRSGDGGVTWSDPIPVAIGNVSNPGFDLFSDPRVAVDPSNPQRILISYVHISALSDCSVFSFALSSLSTVEVVVSNDGGKTFGPVPVDIDRLCFLDTFQQHAGARMAMASDGTAYVAWETNNFLLCQIVCAIFRDSIHVGSFAPTAGRGLPAVTVDQLTPQQGALIAEPFFGIGVQEGVQIRLDFVLQGGFTNPRGFDLAVDHSGGPRDGTVYVAWDDGRNGANAAPEFEDDLFIFDAALTAGAYTFNDIMISSSSDGGQTFTPTRQLNSDLQPLKSRGHDHFRPVLAVDKNGRVAACWYDRRNDPQNYQFERFCAQSKNGGAKWTEFDIPGSLSTPSTQQDWLILRSEMGHNDDLTTDFNGHDAEFLGGFQVTTSGMNPDIKLVRFP